MRNSTTSVLKPTLALAAVFMGCSAVNAAIMNLDDLLGLNTGVHQVTAAGNTFDGYVRNDGGTSWLLVGRGREGWAFNTAGQGGAGANGSAVLDGSDLGTTAAFAPAMYNDTVMNALIAASSSNMTGVEVRLLRASNTAGTTFQDGRWTNWANATWTGDFDQGGGAGSLTVDWEIVNGDLGGPFSNTGSGTRDGFNVGTPAAGNNGQRVFTWAWSGHNNQQGFSYGQTVPGTDGNSPTTFMWENGTENHAIPYTEVYVRLLNPIPEPSTAAVLALGAAGLLLRRRR